MGRNAGVMSGLIVSVVLVTAPMAQAESRPLAQLPADVVRWSTLWMAIPEQMYEVGQEEGPLSAVTWGPAKGTAKFIDSTAKEVWACVKPDEHPVRRASDDVKGAILRYEF